MKKTIVWLLALIFAFSAVALAEAELPAEPEATEYVSEEQGYSFMPPAGWFQMNNEMFQDLVNYVGEELLTQMGLSQAYMDYIAQLGMVVFYNEDMTSNFNLVAQQAPGMTTALLPSLEAALKLQLETIGATGIEFGAMAEFADEEYCTLTYALNGIPTAQYYRVNDGVLYIFTMTNMTDEDVATVLESFVIAA